MVTISPFRGVKDLDWFRERIVKNFDVAFRGRIGPDIKDDKRVTLLNRVIEWTNQGIIYEADQRHADPIVKVMVLEEG